VTPPCIRTLLSSPGENGFFSTLSNPPRDLRVEQVVATPGIAETGRADVQCLPDLTRLDPPCIAVAPFVVRGGRSVGPVYGRRSDVPRADNRSYPAQCRVESHQEHEKEVSGSLPRRGGPISPIERTPGSPKQRRPWR
jgi:hypothetical protein